MLFMLWVMVVVMVTVIATVMAVVGNRHYKPQRPSRTQ